MEDKRSLRQQRLDVVASPPPATSLRRGSSALERCEPGDLLHDYVLLEYPPRIPAAGKLRGLNVLIESFALAGIEDAGVALINHIRQHLGPFRTVWGIKHEPAAPAEKQLRWELYFYDRKREHADLSIDRMRSLLAPHLTVAASEPYPLPWHMFSVEFSPDQLVGAAEAPLDVYVDMRSYKLDGQGLRFENIYTFHYAQAEIDDILHRLRSSLHYRDGHDRLVDLMPPHLVDCRKICVANKSATDALYFSRVTTAALTRFLREHSWPESLRDFVESREDEFSHLCWDVGVDFSRVGGKPKTIKTGIYGSF